MLTKEDFEYLERFERPKVKHKKLEELLAKRLDESMQSFKNKWISEKLEELRIKDWRSMDEWRPM